MFKRTHGFRFSWQDGIVIFLSALIFFVCQYYSQRLVDWLGGHPASAIRKQASEWLQQAGWLIPVVVAHFFIFCNVVRLRRKWELVWSGLFLLNACGWYLWDTWNWWGILGVQTPVTFLLLVCEIKSSQYHGIFSDKLNPNLHQYLSGK